MVVLVCVADEGAEWYNTCIQPADGNRGPQSLYRVPSTLMGEVNWWYWMEPSTASATRGFSAIVWSAGRQAFFYETFCMTRTVPRPTQHVTRLLFGHNRMWRSWTDQLGILTWSPLSMFGTKWGFGSKTWITHLPLSQNYGVLSSRRGLQFAQEGWGHWWKSCHCVCMLFLDIIKYTCNEMNRPNI